MIDYQLLLEQRKILAKAKENGWIDEKEFNRQDINISMDRSLFTPILVKCVIY